MDLGAVVSEHVIADSIGIRKKLAQRQWKNIAHLWNESEISNGEKVFPVFSIALPCLILVHF